MNKFILLVILSLTLFLAQSQIEQVGSPPYNYVVPAKNKGFVVDTYVPASLNSEIKEIGFSFWVKGSYLSPNYFDYSTFNAGATMAHITDNKTGSCSNAYRSKFLDVQLSRPHLNGRKPSYTFSSYQTNKANYFKYIEFPEQRDDFDNEWNFITFSYSFVEKKTIGFTYFGFSKQIGSVEFSDHTKHEPQQLKFRIGACDSNKMNGLQANYHDVNLFYSTTQDGSFISTEQAFNSLRNRRFLPTPIAPVALSENILNERQEFSLTGEGLEKEFTQLGGSDEYAVWGWSKWDYNKSTKGTHAFFKLSSLQLADVQTNRKIGDNTFKCLYQNKNIQCSTYTFDWYAGHKNNVYKNLKVEYDEVYNWFFTYYGYSHKLKKAFLYMKLNGGREETLVWDDVYHMKPDTMTFQLAGDTYYPTFNGEMKNWNVSFGKGFRTENFQELYEQTSFIGDNEVALVEPSQPAPEMISSGIKQKDVYSYSVPEDEIDQIQDTSYSFWFRWNYFDPEDLVIQHARNQIKNLANLSENDYCRSTTKWDRWQSLFLSKFNTGNVKLEFTTFAQNENKASIQKDIEITNRLDFDSTWNFVYYGYSQRTQKLFGYVKFGHSGQVATVSFDQATHVAPKALTFRLGMTNGSLYGFNGQYWNPRFYYKGDSYLGSKEAVDAYFNTSAKPQMYLPPAFKTVSLINGEKTFGYDDKEGLTIGPIEGVSGSREWGIYGWAKWEYISKNKSWNLIYRHSQKNPEDYKNYSYIGDRDFKMAILNSQHIQISNFNSGISARKQNLNLYSNVKYEDQLESWFWFYQCYNYEKRKSFSYLKFANDRVETHEWTDNDKQLVGKPYIYVGNDKFHKGFNGTIKDLNAMYGPGACREGNYEELMNGQSQENNFDDDNFWQQEPIVEKSSVDNRKNKEWYSYEVPTEDLAGITEYSVSGYVKQSMSVPYVGHINQVGRYWKRGVMGITEEDNFCQYNRPGYRTLSVFDTAWIRGNGPSYEFSTYATNKRQNNLKKEIDYAEDQDVDFSWNWVYFGYSLTEQKAFALVKFGRSGIVKSETWDQIAHINDFKKLTFIYGNCGRTNQYGFHGEFYDMRLRYDNMAFKGSQAHALHYLVNSVPSAPVTRPLYGLEPVQVAQRSYLMNQELGEGLQFVNKYTGAEEYAIYGWSKWSYSKTQYAMHNLFKVSTYDKDANYNKLGARALSCYVRRRDLYFSTYKYELSRSWKLNDYKTIKYDNIDSWFFVYFGYNWKTRTATAYVKFQDRTETLIWNDTRHYIPKQFKIELGNDRYYKAFNGQMRGWYFNAGNGSYRDGEFEQLYNKKPWETDIETPIGQLAPSSENIVKPQQESIVPAVQVAEEDLNDAQIYGYWGWTRWSFRTPDYYKVAQFKNKCFAIAKAESVKGKYINTSLCVRPNKTVFYRFCDTYISQCLQFESEKPLKEVIDSWVWVYYAHNEELKKNQAYVFFDNTNQGSYGQQDSQQPIPFTKLELKVGGRQPEEQVFNGYIFDNELETGKDAWVDFEQEGAIDAFRNKNADLPADLNNGEKLPVYLPVKADNEIKVDQNTRPEDASRLINDYKSINEYCVFGNTEVNPVNQIGKTDWVFFFRLTINKPKNLNNVSSIGDRTLAVWFNRSNSMAYVAYDFNFPEQSNLNNHQYTHNFTAEDLQNGFFTYMGYSPRKQKVYLYIELKDGRQFEFALEDVQQIPGSHFGFYLGTDYNGTQVYKNLDAQFSGWHVGLGKGSYYETPLDMNKLKQKTLPIVYEEQIDENELMDGEGNLLVKEDADEEDEKQFNDDDDGEIVKVINLEEDEDAITVGLSQPDFVKELEIEIEDDEDITEILPAVNVDPIVIAPPQIKDGEQTPVIGVPATPKIEEEQEETPAVVGVPAPTQNEEQEGPANVGVPAPTQDEENHNNGVPAPTQNEEQEGPANVGVPAPTQNEESPDNENSEECNVASNDTEYVPNDPSDAPAPEGDCAILYSECNFLGQWEKVCEKIPKVVIDIKSVYIPEGIHIKLFNLPCFQGKTAIFRSTVPCLDNIQFNLLQTYGIKLLNNKKTNLLGRTNKKTSIQAQVEKSSNLNE